MARDGKGNHTYRVRVEWTGNRGTGTSDYRAYGRDHVIGAGEKPPIEGSSDPAIPGDAPMTAANPSMCAGRTLSERANR